MAFNFEEIFNANRDDLIQRYNIEFPQRFVFKNGRTESIPNEMSFEDWSKRNLPRRRKNSANTCGI